MNKNNEFSSYREKLIEHLFIGELLKLSWRYHGCALEISRPEVDNSGYDIVAEMKGIIRHIQIKASTNKGPGYQKVHIKLREKPSACMVWIHFDEGTMHMGPFYYFGDDAGKSMPNLEGFRMAKHTKGD